MTIFVYLKKIILTLVVAYALYLVVGALGPFLGTPKVGEAFQRQWQEKLALYNNQTDCPDRAMIAEQIEDGLDIRLAMIATAEERLWLSSYFLAADQSSRDIVAALYAAAERGVEVRLLGDGMMAPMHMADHAMYYALAAHPNAEIRMYNPPHLLKPWTLNGRLHDKLVVVDDTLFLASGRNIADAYIGGYSPDHMKYDRDIVVYNTKTGDAQASAVHQGAAYYERLWQAPDTKPDFRAIPRGKRQAAAQEAQALPLHYQALQQERPQLFGYDFMANTYPCERTMLLAGSVSKMRKEPQVWQQLVDLMAQSAESVLVQTPYAVLSKDMRADLVAQAGRIDLEIYTNSLPGSANFFAAADYFRTRPNIQAMGAALYEFQAPFSAHGKSLVLDDRVAIVGSFNFDMRSAYLDTETMLVAECPQLAAQLRAAITGPQLMPNRVQADGGYGADAPYSALALPVWKKIALPILSFLIWPLRFLA